MGPKSVKNILISFLCLRNCFQTLKFEFLQEMSHARITPCGHYFHGSCLRKWFNVKQSCPLCHCDLSFHDINTDDNQNSTMDSTMTEESTSPPLSSNEDDDSSINESVHTSTTSTHSIHSVSSGFGGSGSRSVQVVSDDDDTH